MGWIVIKAGGSLTDGHDAEFSRDVPSGASTDEHAKAFTDAKAFIDDCEAKSASYGGST